MDNIFDKIGKKASETYKFTAEKTGKIAKGAKLKLQISELKSNRVDLFQEVGEKVYEKYANGDKSIDLEKDLLEQCKTIKDIDLQIEEMEKECLKLDDKKVCQKCKTEIGKDIKFCPECGQKQPEIKEEVFEAEVVEVEVEKKTDKKEDKEKVKNQEENKEKVNTENKKTEPKKVVAKPKKEKTQKEDLAKTVEVESATKKDEEKSKK